MNKQEVMNYLRNVKNLSTENKFIYYWSILMAVWIVSIGTTHLVCLITSSHLLHETIVGHIVSWILAGLIVFFIVVNFQDKIISLFNRCFEPQSSYINSEVMRS
ncbi:MAG: hypothetical protein AABW67_00585 [Nanoarchaeota archaeon]